MKAAWLLAAITGVARVDGIFVKLGDGFCRTASNEPGTFESLQVADREKCQVACLTQETCLGFEFRSQDEDDNCELHTEEVTQTVESAADSECFGKEFVPLSESRGLDVAVMVGGVFIMHVAFLLKTLVENCSRWRSNQQRRRLKQASRDVRILFDDRGVITKDNFNSKQFQQLERITGLCRTLASNPFCNQTLLKYHKTICGARDVADRCAPSLRNAFLAGSVDQANTGTFDAVESLLNDLMDSKPPASDAQETVNAFKAELAVLYAAYGADAPWMASTAVKKALLGGSGLWWQWSVPGFQHNPVTQLSMKADSLKFSKTPGNRLSKMAQYMEPKQKVGGVRARSYGCLSWAVDLREQLGVGSRRLGFATLVVLGALGLVRFVGTTPALVLVAAIGAQLVLEILSACELQGSKNRATNLVRISMPIALGLVVAIFLGVSGGRPVESNAEIEKRFTFLPVPPQYSLETITSQRLYVGVVYGIMHANLAVLCLLPLPISYGLQALLVQRLPGLRALVPQSAVWWHRLLGYLLVGGLSVTGMIWLVFQGNECYVNRNIQSCEAFEPQLAAGIDVYVLRFHIVWPLMFFFIPLMIWGRYPESWEGSAPPKRAKAPAAEPKGEPRKTSNDPAAADVQPPSAWRNKLNQAVEEKRAGESTNSAKSEKRAGESTNSAKTDPAKRAGESANSAKPSRAGEEAQSGKSVSHARTAGGAAQGSNTGPVGAVLGFLYRRLLDVVPFMVVLAGCHHVLIERFIIFFPFWFIDLVILSLHTFFRLRSFVASVTGECCCLRRNDEMTEFFRRSWWEAAYSSHVFAFTTMSFFAVFYRLEVFYPIFLTWGLYFADRLVFLFRAYAHRMRIVVGRGTSSYVVNSGEGDRAEPSHVRLVLEKPPGFTYKAGQWCQLALPHCGAYWGSPSVCLPFMQWHAFSIASKPTDDYLEFHIGVHIASGIFGAQQKVVAAKAEGEEVVRVSRKGSVLDWLCPHRVPYLDQKREIRGEFAVESTGMYLTLRGEDGTKVKTLKPQMQFTGRLWNTVQRMLEANGQGREGLREHTVHLAGPYGTLPWTIEAHQAVMLIGAGVGFPSTGAMLRQLLEDNLLLPTTEQRSVCFIWSASKLDQLLLCFPSLLVDLTKYVHKKNGLLTSGISDLKKWLHIKIFISNFEPGEFLSLNPGQALFPEGGKMSRALDEVRAWLLAQEVVVDSGSGETVDADGTYIAQGSLGASFSKILHNSYFTQRLVERKQSLGVSYCGPPELCSLLRSDIANTILPTKIEFAAEFAA